MPISPIDGCDERHWADVKEILFDAIESAGYDPDLVSNANDAGIIQNRIVQNLYDNEVVVVDVSGKNPNCMFELGMRLAFDKPTIIVKDNVTGYSFDTSPIEHVGYPRDLRFGNIVSFKRELAEKIVGTARAARDPEYKTFLKHFTNIKPSKIETKEVPEADLILSELRNLQSVVRRSMSGSGRLPQTPPVIHDPSIPYQVAHIIRKVYENYRGVGVHELHRIKNTAIQEIRATFGDALLNSVFDAPSSLDTFTALRLEKMFEDSEETERQRIIEENGG